MTFENVKKLYNHFCMLADGNFKERDFDKVYESDDPQDEGMTKQGKFTPERIALLKSDALIRKKELEEKFPMLLEKEQVEEKPKKNSKKE